MKRLRDAEVFDHVVLDFAARTGSRVTIAKDFPPEIEKLEARLRQCGADYEREVVRDPETGKFVEKRFELVADFQSSVRVLPDHDRGQAAFNVANVDGFETVSVVFPAFEVGSARLDELALDQRRAARVPARRPASAPRRRLTVRGGRRPPARLRSLPSNCPCRSSGSRTPPTSPRSSTS